MPFAVLLMFEDPLYRAKRIRFCKFCFRFSRSWVIVGEYDLIIATLYHGRIGNFYLNRGRRRTSLMVNRHIALWRRWLGGARPGRLWRSGHDDRRAFQHPERRF